MTILVTGGAGFIGTNLIKRLLSEGHDVTSIDNYSTGLKSNHQKGCNYKEKDIVNYDWRGEYYDCVFHMAAIARIQPSFKRPEDYINTNFSGTYSVVKYCLKHNIPLIYGGSSSHHTGRFSNPYTFSKDMGEDIIKLYQHHFNLQANIVRFYNVYGPYQLEEGGYTTLIGRWMYNIKNNKQCEIYGDGEQRRDFTHVDDIVDALVKMLDNPKGSDYELGRGQNYSVNEVARMFNIKPIYKPRKPGEAEITLCKCRLAKLILNWQPQKELLNYIENFQNEVLY